MDVPEMAPYARHVFICAGPFCDPEGKAKRLYTQLALKLGELGQYDNPRRVKRGSLPVWAFATAVLSWSSTRTASGITMWMMPCWTGSSRNICAMAGRSKMRSTIGSKVPTPPM